MPNYAYHRCAHQFSKASCQISILSLLAIFLRTKQPLQVTPSILLILIYFVCLSTKMKSAKNFRMEMYGSGIMAKRIFRMSDLFLKKLIFCTLNKAIFSILYNMYEQLIHFGEVWEWNYEKIHFGIMLISDSLEMRLQNKERFKNFGHFDVNFLKALQ